ncbi:MAG: DUF1573 domain-containing protein [Flavobacteriaceae bacterium]|nr:DUF1573 domain-containing protein [Flavobacteriaceae bacterium]
MMRLSHSIVLGIAVFFFTTTSAQVITEGNTAATKGSNATIKFENTSHSFGNIIEGQIARYDFKFINAGTESLVLSNVSASCGCTTPKWPREAIDPSKSNIITAEYNSQGRPGTFTKSIFVKSNGGEVTLTISGNVIKEPEAPRSPIIIR